MTETQLVVNHLLFFVANKYSTTARDKIVETVVTFYADFDEMTQKSCFTRKSIKTSHHAVGMTKQPKPHLILWKLLSLATTEALVCPYLLQRITEKFLLRQMEP